MNHRISQIATQAEVPTNNDVWPALRTRVGWFSVGSCRTCTIPNLQLSCAPVATNTHLRTNRSLMKSDWLRAISQSVRRPLNLCVFGTSSTAQQQRHRRSVQKQPSCCTFCISVHGNPSFDDETNSNNSTTRTNSPVDHF
jgi:hypothetical protein